MLLLLWIVGLFRHYESRVMCSCSGSLRLVQLVSIRQACYVSYYLNPRVHGRGLCVQFHRPIGYVLQYLPILMATDYRGVLHHHHWTIFWNHSLVLHVWLLQGWCSKLLIIQRDFFSDICCIHQRCNCFWTCRKSWWAQVCLEKHYSFYNFMVGHIFNNPFWKFYPNCKELSPSKHSK